MRRGGVNPTDVEMVSIINKHDNTSGYIDIKVSRQQISKNGMEYCRNFVTSCRRQQERTMMKLDTRKHSGALFR